jgi:hypothetical protein
MSAAGTRNQSSHRRQPGQVYTSRSNQLAAHAAATPDTMLTATI